MTTTSTPKTAHISAWDRAVVIALGGAGCALSYDALQQMAVAIHVRGLLTFVFPLVIDGFIAYGVRALLVLRDARCAPGSTSGRSSARPPPPASGPTRSTRCGSTRTRSPAPASGSGTPWSRCCPPSPRWLWPEPSTSYILIARGRSRTVIARTSVRPVTSVRPTGATAQRSPGPTGSVSSRRPVSRSPPGPTGSRSPGQAGLCPRSLSGAGLRRTAAPRSPVTGVSGTRPLTCPDSRTPRARSLTAPTTPPRRPATRTAGGGHRPAGHSVGHRPVGH